MLSIANITNAAQAAAYFSKDDYYLDREQREPSAWWGRGAAYLKLSGEVDRVSFQKLLARELPPEHDGPEIAGQGVAADPKAAEKKRRVGVDLTFSAPKSVSLMALVGGDTRLAQAHDKAVETALVYLQEEASMARVTCGGETTFERTGNFIVARFQHDTSRHLDPQMHTHCVVMNLTQRSDGAWRAISNQGIYRHKMAAGAIYRAELAHALHQLGYGIEKQHADGRFELEGFKPGELEAFSKRRVEIVAALQKSHHPDAKAAARVTLMTRQAKRDANRNHLGESWQSQAHTVNIDFERVRRGFDPQRILHRATPEQALDYAVEHITERDVRCDTADLIRHALGRGMGYVRYDDLKEAIALDVSENRLLPVQRPKLHEDRGPRYTTKQMLALEKELINIVQAGRGQHQPMLDRTPNLQSVASGQTLTPGQKRAVEVLLTSRDAVVAVQGYAGTGKTTMLQEIKRHADAQGYQLSGYAPSGAAAEVLESQTGIKSRTIARHLVERHSESDKGVANSDDKPPIWVVDELSMVGNQDAATLFRLAQRKGARLLLLGDKGQLPSIAAGKVFDLLIEHGMTTATMKDIVRQSDPTLKKAVMHAIAGNSDASLALVEVVDKNSLGLLAQHYLRIPSTERRDAMVVTLTHAARQCICTTVRGTLRAEGEIVGPEVRTRIYTKEDLTRAQVREAAHYSPGQVVRFGRTYQNLGIEKGAYLTVSSIDIPTNTVHLKNSQTSVAWQPHRANKVEVYAVEKRCLAQGDQIRWTRNEDTLQRRNGHTAPVMELSDDGKEATVLCRGAPQKIDMTKPGHWEYAYVSTLAAAQGSTAKQVLLHLSTKAKAIAGLEAWYVGISRAKATLRVYTDDREKLPAVIARSMQKHSAIQQHELVKPAVLAPAQQNIRAETNKIPSARWRDVGAEIQMSRT